MLMKQTNVEAKSMAHADVVDPLQPAAENDWRLLVIWKGRSNALCISKAQRQMTTKTQGTSVASHAIKLQENSKKCYTREITAQNLSLYSTRHVRT